MCKFNFEVTVNGGFEMVGDSAEYTIRPTAAGEWALDVSIPFGGESTYICETLIQCKRIIRNYEMKGVA